MSDRRANGSFMKTSVKTIGYLATTGWMSGSTDPARQTRDLPQSNGTRTSRGTAIAYWISTSLFALQMGFTAYAQLCLPQVAQVFAHLGFPGYFRIELSLLKFAGIVVLLLPMAPA